jgi:hypothetical protein
MLMTGLTPKEHGMWYIADHFRRVLRWEFLEAFTMTSNLVDVLVSIAYV